MNTPLECADCGTPLTVPAGGAQAVECVACGGLTATVRLGGAALSEPPVHAVRAQDVTPLLPKVIG